MSYTSFSNSMGKHDNYQWFTEKDMRFGLPSFKIIENVEKSIVSAWYVSDYKLVELHRWFVGVLKK